MDLEREIEDLKRRVALIEKRLSASQEITIRQEPVEQLSLIPKAEDDIRAFRSWAANEHNRVERNGGPESWRAWSNNIDWPAITKAWKKLGDAETRRRWLIFLNNDDPFYDGHLPRFFLTHLAKFARPPRLRTRTSGTDAALSRFVKRGER